MVSWTWHSLLRGDTAGDIIAMIKKWTITRKGGVEQLHFENNDEKEELIAYFGFLRSKHYGQTKRRNQIRPHIVFAIEKAITEDIFFLEQVSDPHFIFCFRIK